MTAWTPPAVAAPDGWVDIVPAISVSYPSGATITPISGGGYKVSTKVRAATDGGGQTRIVFTSSTADYLFKEGYYVSFTLPDCVLADANKPKSMQILTQDSAGGDRWSAGVSDIGKTNTWLQGKIDCLYEHEELGGSKGVIFDIYWHDGRTADAVYEFTINTFKVKAEYTPPSEVNPWPATILSEPGGLTVLTDAQMKAIAKNWNVDSINVAEIGSTGTYKVTVNSSQTTEARIRFTPAATFKEAYLSFTFPATGDVKLTKVAVYAGSDNSFDNPMWTASYVSPEDAAKYYGDQLDISVDFSANASDAVTGIIYLYLSEKGTYEFTINKISVK